jgi:hypothetical protein
MRRKVDPVQTEELPSSNAEAEAILGELASVFLSKAAPSSADADKSGHGRRRYGAPFNDEELPKRESMYRVLVEQIPAVVFIAYLDGGISEAYVSPQIETVVTGKPLQSAYRVIARDGRVVWFDCAV